MDEYRPEIQALIDRYRPKVRFAGAQHGKVKQVQALQTNTKPNPHKLCVLEGIWAHQKSRMADLTLDSFFLCPDFAYSPEALALADDAMRRAPDVYIVSGKVFERISERDGPDGLLSIAQFPLSTPKDIPMTDHALVVVLDGVEIPGNIGTVLRTMDGCGADALILCNRRARLTHPKLIKGSMGAAFFKPIVEFEDTQDAINFLLKNGFGIFLADTRAARHYHQQDFSGRAALVMGSERYGITKAWYQAPHTGVSIPMLGVCDSLNVAIATSLLLYQAGMQRLDRQKDQ